jgi:DNA repair photolyase
VVERGNAALFNDVMRPHWSLTPYKLCDFRCVYCCTGAQGESKPLTSIPAAVDETRRWLVETEQPRYVILGAFTDAYPSVEGDLGLTRAILRELVEAGERFTIVTKGTAVLRDIDLLRAADPRCLVQVSICSTDEAVLRRLDPGAPSGAARFDVIEALVRNGIRTGLNVLPWIPDVTDTESLINRVPPNVEIVLGPLTFGKQSDSRTLLGRLFTRDEVVRRYYDEYERLGHVLNTSWIRPAPPPYENSARNRLPQPDAPGTFSRASSL